MNAVQFPPNLADTVSAKQIEDNNITTETNQTNTFSPKNIFGAVVFNNKIIFL
jgi:hypothetical protein